MSELAKQGREVEPGRGLCEEEGTGGVVLAVHDGVCVGGVGRLSVDGLLPAAGGHLALGAGGDGDAEGVDDLRRGVQARGERLGREVRVQRERHGAQLHVQDGAHAAHLAGGAAEHGRLVAAARRQRQQRRRGLGHGVGGGRQRDDRDWRGRVVDGGFGLWEVLMVGE